MTQKTRKLSEKYFEKNGGIDEVFNDIDKKDEYAKFLTKALKIRWTQKRSE